MNVRGHIRAYNQTITSRLDTQTTIHVPPNILGSFILLITLSLDSMPNHGHDLQLIRV